MALAHLDEIQDRIYFCPLTRRPVHLEHSRRLPYNSSPAEETAEASFSKSVAALTRVDAVLG
jgi:hypothetical protein